MRRAPVQEPKLYTVVGPTRVHDTDPGGRFTMAMTEGQERALIQGGHIIVGSRRRKKGAAAAAPTTSRRRKARTPTGSTPPRKTLGGTPGKPLIPGGTDG